MKNIYQITPLLIYIPLIFSYLWGTFFFFKVNERSAKNRNFYSALVTPVTLLIAIGLLWPNRSNLVSAIVASSLLTLALILFWSAIVANKTTRLNYAFSKEMPNNLTTTGPYRFIRHPLYTAYTIGWLGGIIGTGYYWLFIAIIPLLIYYYKAANQEEKLFTQSSFSQEYNAYIRRTGMFLPKKWQN